jgi:MFS family permease
VAAISGGLVLYSMGFGLTVVSMANRVNDIGDRAILLGLLGLAEFAPVFGLALVTGSVADRFDRRRTVMLGQAAMVAVIMGLVALTSGADTSLAPYYVAAVALGACRAFVSPSYRPLVPAAVPDALIARAMSFYSGSWQVAFAVGPLLFFLYGWAPRWAFLAGAALVAAGLLATSFVPPEVGRAHLASVPPERPTLRTALEGLHVIRRNPVLLGAISLDLAAVLFGGAVALLPRLSTNVLDLDAWQQGVLRSAGGVGAVGVAILLAARPVTRHVGMVLLASVALFGVFTITLGLSGGLIAAAASHAALLGADSVSVFIRSAVVPIVTPPEQQGRVSAVEGVFIGASNELGAFESGVAAQLLGTRGGIVSGGVLTLAVVGVFWFAFPSLRRLNRFEDAKALSGAGGR